MERVFQFGDEVREKWGDDRELFVERYDADGLVICTYWIGASRRREAIPEFRLERVPVAELK